MKIIEKNLKNPETFFEKIQLVIEAELISLSSYRANFIFQEKLNI